jgi:hypothetical protein
MIKFEKSVSGEWLVNEGWLVKKDYLDGDGVYKFVMNIDNDECEDWVKVSENNELDEEFLEDVSDEVEMYRGDVEVIEFDDEDFDCVVVDYYVWVKG